MNFNSLASAGGIIHQCFQEIKKLAKSYGELWLPRDAA